jgi:alpha-tubulin suppressor-like RCC1 family protein
VSSTWLPVQVSNLTNASAIAAGDDHSVALRADGTVWTWGANEWGQLGNGGTGASSSVPVKVLGSTANPIERISSGYFHIIALEARGALQSWGSNANGVLGTGDASLPFSTRPLYVPFTAATDVSIGCFHQLALHSTPSMNATPGQVPGLTSVSAVSAGLYHMLALTEGLLASWGLNSYGQLGYGSSAYYVEAPTTFYQNVKGISAGWFHSAVVIGAPWLAGGGGSGELGNGTQSVSSSLIPLPGLTGACTVRAGYQVSAALTR